ncbi:MAG: ribbon-helix-helix protein, CopG family [Deltaproteobacteria bacterium]|nr:ribbon-helix-helix protein, CopG family [Deltaproteobacteria bacterium]
MSMRSIQVTIDASLLQQVDRQPETRKRGRSAVVRRALRVYLDLTKRREIDAAYARAYGDRGDDDLKELGELIGEQARPET